MHARGGLGVGILSVVSRDAAVAVLVAAVLVAADIVGVGGGCGGGGEVRGARLC